MRDFRLSPSRALLGWALVAGALTAVAAPSFSQEAAGGPPERAVADPPPLADAPAPLLEVPFVPQTPELCGGAAVTMVVRYWGGEGVSPRDFAHLVSDEARGIPTGALRRAAERSGWRAVAFRGDSAEIRDQLGRGRPLIALIRVAPNRYHYVVLVGSLGDRMVLHDPARGPYLTPRWEELREAWEPAGRWAMLLLPAQDVSPSRARRKVPGEAHPDEAHADGERSPCAGLVARGVALAREGAAEAADAALVAAAAACPEAAAPLRERAGLRLREGRADEAARLSERALSRDPDDPHAARTLAAARYLGGESRAALAAWNRVDAPRIDLVQTEGARKVPPPAVLRAVGLHPGQLLSPAAFGRAERRLAHLPAAEASRLAYHPLPGGSARVIAAIQEARSLPSGPTELVVAAARTAVQREAVLQAASPMRGGELWMARWGFESGRPAVRLKLAAPASWPATGGVWRVEIGWERQSYRRPGLAEAGFADPGLAAVAEERLRGALELSRWESGWLRWRFGTSLDRWDRPGRHLALSGGVALRLLEDRLSLAGGGERWFSLEAGSPFSRVEGTAEWRSRAERRGLVWSLTGGGELASPGAPLALWGGAGAGRAREPYLRAHPLLRDGDVAGPAFGRAVAHGSAELVAWTGPGARLPLPWRLGVAAFVDLARWGKNLPREPRGQLHADAGLGLRLAPGGEGGTLRLDVARGIRDGETALTAGWEAAWPRLER